MQPEQPVRLTTGSLIGDPAAAMPSRPPARRRPGASVITTSGRADRCDVYRLKKQVKCVRLELGLCPMSGRGLGAGGGWDRTRNRAPWPQFGRPYRPPMVLTV